MMIGIEFPKEEDEEEEILFEPKGKEPGNLQRSPYMLWMDV